MINKPDSILRRGDGMSGREESREAVRNLQRLLGENGFPTAVDGLFGPKTETALRAFQKDRELPVNGVADARTWESLRAISNKSVYSPNHPFLLRQLNAATPYRPIAEQLANRFDLRLSWIAGVCSRESAWGLTLRPPGPAGTGDWIERPRLRAGRTGPMPPDEKGFGRGFMQIDYDSHTFARNGPWMDPAANLEYGCATLRDMRNYLQARASLNNNALTLGMLAAYNAGPSRVLRAIRQGKHVDEVTTGKDYATDVLRRAAWFSAYGW